MYDTSGYDEEFPFLCDECLGVTLQEMGKGKPWSGGRMPESRPVIAHKDLERPVYYVYVLKLSDGGFYVGQTTSLPVRLKEHKDGLQGHTKGKDPRLVFFETFVGGRGEVNEVENELTLLNKTKAGQRRLREMIERFRAPLKLIDLEA
ncbi:MAG: GIY-YIG nuclease family protein [Chloroflexi bacterium]|nr:GIY-YIG nuclease family protein [Chloroflexota bacterium]